jgi:hypothetical protein
MRNSKETIDDLVDPEVRWGSYFRKERGNGNVVRMICDI